MMNSQLYNNNQELLDQHFKYQKKWDLIHGPSPLWLAKIRYEGINKYTSLTPKKKVMGNWKDLQNDLDAVIQQSTASIKKTSHALNNLYPNLLFQYLPEAKNIISIVDGRFAPLLSNLPLDNNIQIRPLENVIDSTEQFEEHFKHTNDNVSSLNQAYFSNGLYIEIGPNASVVSPLFIVNMTTINYKERIISPRNIINIKENSKCTIVETHFSDQSSSSVMNSVTDIHQEENSLLNHYKIVHLNDDKSININETIVNVESNSTFNSIAYYTGGKNTYNFYQVNLLKENASANVHGVYTLSGKQKSSHSITMNHLAPRTYSNMQYKGILNDESHGAFVGKVKVQKDSQLIESKQTNKNLLLSDNATVSTTPELEIDANDVKCSHGATIGQLRPSQLFYLQSRGISKERAYKMLIKAFAEDIVLKSCDALPEKLLRTLINQDLTS